MSINKLTQSITCHCWNADKSKVALCPNNNEIHIYKKSGNNFELETVLKEHDQVVTGLDWGHKTNRLVSCSQDRNAYVWTLEGNVWKPVLVILRIDRAATQVKWSPLENKFAVACGAKAVSICYFEEDNVWWVSKHIKKSKKTPDTAIKSTVLSIDWHPNNAIIAIGSCDFTCKIVSAAIRGVDKKPPETPLGNVPAFGKLMWNTTTLGWVHAVKFSGSGNTLAFASHDSAVSFVDLATQSVQLVRTDKLPFSDLLFLDENRCIAVGHDCNPALFTKGGEWAFTKFLDGGGAGAPKAGPAKNAAFAMFQDKVDRGGESSGASELTTKHQGTISCIQPFSGTNGSCQEFSTSGLDGMIGIWKA